MRSGSSNCYWEIARWTADGDQKTAFQQETPFLRGQIFEKPHGKMRRKISGSVEMRGFEGGAPADLTGFSEKRTLPENLPMV